MPHLTDVPITRIQLAFDPSPSPKARVEQLRGAIAAAFPDDDLFHQHQPEGEGSRFVYRYPRVQYNWHRGCGTLTGIREAAGRLAEVPWLDLALRLGPDAVTVSDARIETRRSPVGIADTLIRYVFETPWIFLNQENHARFQTLEDGEKAREADRILVGHLLSALDGLGFRVPEGIRLYAAFELDRLVRRRYKDVGFEAGRGSFVANVSLPDGIGLGKGTSHGHGRIRRPR